MWHVPRWSYALLLLLLSKVNSEDEKILKVHIVAHTHDDPGWLKTYDQYYNGLNNTIAHAGVRYILDSVIVALKENPQRQFTYVEMAFFSRYYNELSSEEERNDVKQLVANGQLSFANGGYVMHDEATTHYISMIDQTTLGHDFLKDTFEYTPKVGWQLDPFGHSLFNAELSSLCGFDSLYFGRIDHEDLERRYEAQECEGVWNGVFWGLTGSYRGNYGPPPGFCLDDKCNDIPITPENAYSRAVEFVGYLIEQGKHTKGDTIMVTMGSDFTYENALYDFRNLDLLMQTIQNSNFSSTLLSPYNAIDIFYSTPEFYTQSKYNESSSSSNVVPNNNWSVKEDDFFPYSDCRHCFWTGYFTSRPNFKRMERVSSGLLHAVRQLHSFLQQPARYDNAEGEIILPYASLESSLSIAQHHDAVSGTSKQHVLYDYAKLLHQGISEATTYAGQALTALLLGQQTIQAQHPTLEYCIELNVSRCDITQESSLRNQSFQVILYNALTTPRKDILSIPVSLDVTYKVTSNYNNLTLASVLLRNYNYTKTSNSAPFLLHFNTGYIPPLSSIVYTIQQINTHSSVIKPIPHHRILRLKHKYQFKHQAENKPIQLYVEQCDDHIYIENSKLKIRLDKHMGLMDHITNIEMNATLKVKQTWGYYPSFDAKYNAPGSSKKSSSKKGSKKGKEHISNAFGKSSSLSTRILSSNTSRTSNYDQYFSNQKSDDNSEKTQNSGAYIFRPKHRKGGIHTTPLSSEVTIFHSDLITELHYKYRGKSGRKYITQIIRLKQDSDVLESEYVVGPIPDNDRKGREVVVQYDTNVDNQGVFFTDSNGRRFMERKRSYRPTWDYKDYEPIAGNYYPINSAIFIKDNDVASNNSDKVSLAILTDRSLGGGSIYDGELEIMVHRRTKADDGRGVGEPLDETNGGITPEPPYGKAKRKGKGIVTTGKHYLLITSANHTASFCRSKMDQVYSPIHIFFSSSPSTDNLFYNHSSFNGISVPLPENIMLVTFKRVQQSQPYMTYLIRLAHQYSIDEDPNLSSPVQIDIQNLFTSKLFTAVKVVSVVEKTVTGNRDWADWERERLKWNDIKDSTKKVETTWNDSNTIVQLKPMEIRTFYVVLGGRFNVEVDDDSTHLAFL